MTLQEQLKERAEKHGETKKSTKVQRMHIERAANGGFVVEHRSGGVEYKEPVKHAIKSGKELVKHVKEHMTEDDE